MTPRPAVTNRGLWLARHSKLQALRRDCETGCPVCEEQAGYQADYTTPPPPSLATVLATRPYQNTRPPKPDKPPKPKPMPVDPWGNPLGQRG